ncbi:MAG: hypothetical protein U5J99_00860 [Parvularculaceae bacterium]|nr:hypothetical protein [Parvularculaceae bacterium]
MTTGPLTAAGLFSCTLALIVQLFPNAAFSVGADVSAAGRLFAFGVFLIAVAALTTAAAQRCACVGQGSRPSDR